MDVVDAVDPGAEDDPVAAVLTARRAERPLLLRTSGTAGAARGVLRSTDSWWDSFAAVRRLIGHGPGSRVWVPGPLSATMNLFARVHAVEAGAALVEEPGEATHAHLTPAHLARDLDRLHPGTVVVTAGATLPGALADRARRAGLRMHAYYGAAELSFVAWDTGTGLRGFPGVEIEIRDSLIWVRSPYVCQQVLGPAGEPTRVGSWRREGAWCTVGDRGRFDGDVLVVHGRGEDAVTTGGATVPVADVERVLTEAAPVTVLGVAHPDLGQVLVAVAASQEVVATLREVARARLPVTHRPRRWYVAEPTLTPAGKVDRAALREWVTSRGSPLGG